MANPWLALLLAGGSPEDVTQLRERTPDSDGDAAATLQVLAQLGERKQRAAELATLYDLAVRLTAVREPDALLQEIVTQGRRLLGVDVAYLALREGADELVIRVVDGTSGPHLKGVRFSSEGGLAGQVASSGEPFWTSDYTNEPGIQHRPDVDEIAQGERLQSILGVPLRRGAETMGVLFAAERASRPFSATEVSLMASLAAHAVVAIDNARLFSDLAESNRQLTETADTVQRAAAHHDRLMEIALRGGGVPDVIDSLTALLTGEVRFVAADEVVPEPPDGVTTSVPVIGGNQPLGTLQLTSAELPLERDLRLLERSSMAIALLLSAERAATESEWRTADEVLATLLQDRGVDPDLLHRRARSAGLDLQRPHSVVVLGSAGDLTQALAAGRQVVAAAGGLVGRHRGSVVLVLPVSPEDAVKHCSDLRPRVTCGVAGPATGQAALVEAYEDARRCAHVLDALGRVGGVSTPAALGPYRFLLSQSGRDDAQIFIDAQIGALLAHDEERGTDLTATLATFLASGRQHAQSARDLAIHSNTLYQRLDRISQIVGDDWRGAARSFDLQVALHMHELSRDA